MLGADDPMEAHKLTQEQFSNQGQREAVEGVNPFLRNVTFFSRKSFKRYAKFFSMVE